MNGIIRYPHLVAPIICKAPALLHYFETVERYYQTGNEEQKSMYRDRLEAILHDVNRSEQFIAFLWLTPFTS